MSLFLIVVYSICFILLVFSAFSKWSNGYGDISTGAGLLITAMIICGFGSFVGALFDWKTIEERVYPTIEYNIQSKIATANWEYDNKLNETYYADFSKSDIDSLFNKDTKWYTSKDLNHFGMINKLDIYYVNPKVEPKPSDIIIIEYKKDDNKELEKEEIPDDNVKRNIIEI